MIPVGRLEGSVHTPSLENGRPSAQAIAALRAHPRFAEAARTSANSIVALYQGNRLLNTLVNDRGRALMGYFALYMHFFHDPSDPLSGLTVSRMKQLCVEQNVCSAGRAEAMLVLMRLFGYLEPAPSNDDRRTRRLVATDRLIESYHERWERLFAAMALVAAEAGTAAAVVRRDDFTRALVRQLMEHFTAGLRVLDYAPELALFADHNSGMMILFSLLLSGEPEDAFPPAQPVTVSISALARRFGVSRVHVRKLLRDAERQGFVARVAGADNRFLLLPPLRDRSLDFFATVFLFMAQCARAALQECGAKPQTRTA